MSKASHNALFHKKTLKKFLDTYAFPVDLEKRHQKILPWIKTLERGTLDQVKETSLHGDFLKNIFQEVLGYRSVIEGEGRSWEIHAEKTISGGGGAADGALGFFSSLEGKKGAVKLKGRTIAPIELKGAKNDLDRPAPGRKESAVHQGWRYANYTPDCKWVIVSNYREIRLYQTSKTPAFYERFNLKELAEVDEFKKFYFLLCRQNFLPNESDVTKPSRLDEILRQSGEAEESVTKALYKEYKNVRLALAQHFRAIGPKNLPNREEVLIEKAQKVLDRILFIAFAEDRRLIPDKTLAQAHNNKDLYSPRSIWENYKTVFHWIDKGNENPSIPGYNGGLFKLDSLLDESLDVPDEICSQLKELARFDFDDEVSVDILGRIFEQSVTDLEELRALAKGEDYDLKKGKRRKDGVFYTPAFITQFIVELALGSYLERRQQQLPERKALSDIASNATKQRREAEIRFWEAYRDQVLLKTRIIDPACGSGAFLIAAFEYLSRQYDIVNEAIADLKGSSRRKKDSVGQRSLFDLNKTILNGNLYGVDLSPESVEITKLALWLKTAEPGKQLTYLDNNIRSGNSIIADLQAHPNAFNWESAFPDVFADGGFDVVIGNPPYVRQELLTPFKSYLEKHYTTYDGMADIYVYFYEKGLNILRPNGILSYIVTNKWLRAGYGKPLRQFFSENSIFEKIIDFGHAPIFEDADVFPCVVSARKTENEEIKEFQKLESPVRVCSVPRDQLKNINLLQYINQEGYEIPWSRYSEDEWSLEHPVVEKLMEKIVQAGEGLKSFANSEIYRGVTTGLNTAFLIDQETRDRLVQEDAKSAEVIKPYLRGQDIGRWNANWQKLWMIFTRRGIDIDKYSAVKKHLEAFRERLEPKPKDWDKVKDGKWPGRKGGSYKWYEIQDSTDYWRFFEKPKIFYQEIQFHPRYAYSGDSSFANNKVSFITSGDLYLLAALNSPLLWWHNWRHFPHMKDEALAPVGYLLENLPIAAPTDKIRAEVESAVQRLLKLTKANQEANREVLDWLQIEHGIEKPGNKLGDFASQPINDFLKEVKKRRPKSTGSFSPGILKELKDVYNDYALPIQSRLSESLTLEHRISDLVNESYGLTPEEIDLMWKTAPLRMPFQKPSAR